jgi:hyaluronoglucosaminidase
MTPNHSHGPAKPLRWLTAGLLLAATLASAPAGSAAASPPPVPAAPVIAPAPKSLTVHGGPLAIPAVAGIVAGAASDASAVQVVTSFLRAAGVRRIVPASDSGPAPHTPLTVWIGGPAENTATAGALDALHARGPSGLPAEGYVLASGRVNGTAAVALSGVDTTGTFYAAQTLRQLVTGPPGHAQLAAVTVRDWPTLAHRGVVEGFYGAPWSQHDRLAQLDFYGAHKLDTYVYAPKNDPYSRDRWREPYPSGTLRQLQALAERAHAQHVRFVYAVSPGQDLCYSSDSDFAALTRKDQALYDVGVRDFAIFFDDISQSLGCAQDQARFGTDPSPLAAAQAYLLNRFQHQFLDSHAGTGPLLTVPTDYSGNADSVYRDRFGALLAAQVIVSWTGPDVVSATVTDADADAAASQFRHPLALWDNYPVNDYAPQRLFLGPLEGRSPALAQHGVSWLIANPMIQAAPSTLPLQTVADYAWSPAQYDPQRAWDVALRQIGGVAAGALRIFADNSRSSTLDANESPTLTALADRFWTALGAGDPATAGDRLARYFDAMASAPAAIRAALPDIGTEAGPWLDKLHWYGVAGAAATRTLLAQHAGDATAAWHDRVTMEQAAAQAGGIYQSIAPGVMDAFLDRARHAASQVVITSPGDNATFAAGSAVTVDVSVDSGSVPIQRVDVYAGPTKVASDATAPYRVTLPATTDSYRTLVAKAVDGDGNAVASTPVHVTVGSPKAALLVVGSDASSASGPGLAPGDAAVRDELEYLGMPVVIETATQASTADATGKALIAISSTVSSGDVNTKFRDVAVPVIVWEAYDFDDLGMTTQQGENFRSAQVQVVDPSSPLAAGRSGIVDVYRGLDRIRWGVVAPGAQVAAVVPGSPDDATLFGYDKGAQMVGMTAPARRVGIFLGDTGLDPQVVTPDAVAMFDASVDWLLGR